MLQKMLRYFTLPPLLLFLFLVGNSAGNSAPLKGLAPNVPTLVPGPDVIVGGLPNLIQAGSSGTQVGLAMGTDTCNNGDVELNFFAMANTDHPVMPQNLYRMSGGAANDARFEQVGQSWLKHAFFALQQNACGFGCTPASGGNHLGVGCSNPDSANLNANQLGLGSRAWVNPFTGVFPSTANSHTGHTHSNTAHRLLVEGSDLDTTLNPGATYWAEAQLVTPHEYAWCLDNSGQCNMFNNVSYRQFNVAGTTSFTFSPVGDTVRMAPAINAWTGATINPIEPAPGTDGRAFVAYKVTGPVAGVWHYEYAIYNENLDRGIQSFSVPLGCGIAVSDIGFHAPLNHPGFANDGTLGGAGYSNAVWTSNQSASDLSWSSETFAQNQNANAIRWGTLYNFRYDSNRPPQAANATIGFFKTGTSITAGIQGPAPDTCTGATPTPTPTATPSPTPCGLITHFSENFDGVPAPALPAGWVSGFTPGPANCTPAGTCALGTHWATSTTDPDTAPNCAFHDAPGCVTDSVLDTPSFVSGDNSTLLIFRHSYDLENGLDGAVLEISIDGGPFVDFVAAGGSNPQYNGTILPGSFSPIAGRAAWTGNSGGYVTSTALMPFPSGTVRLRFRLATDCSGASTGWRIDSVSVASNIGCPSPTPTATPPQPATHFEVVAPSIVNLGYNFSFTVRAVDQFGNTATGYAGTMHFTSTSPGSLPPDSTLTNGTGHFVATLHTEGNHTITATDTVDPSVTGTSNNIFVIHDQASPTPSPPPPLSPTPTPTVTPSPPTPTSTPSPTPPTQALNLSTRLRVQTGDNAGIGGFIITGSSPNQVLLRGLGPSLIASGITDALANPTLDLRDSAGARILANNDWRDTQETEIEATGIPPTDDLEAAIVQTLAPGSYTVILRGMGMTTGVGLVEIYDLNPGVDSKLANLSTRGFVDTGDNIVIAGFILGGNGDDRIVVRGIGPSLIALGLPNALPDPTLELRDSNGALLVANNDWQDDQAQAAELTAAGLAPTKNLESGIAATLAPGAYTALLAGANNGTGVGVVEVYDRGAPP